MIEDQIAGRKVKDEGSDVLSRIGANEEGLSEKKVRPAAAKRVKEGHTDWLAQTACFV